MEEGDLGLILQRSEESTPGHVDVFLSREIDSNGINYRTQKIVFRAGGLKCIEFPVSSLKLLINELIKIQHILHEGDFHPKNEIPYSFQWLKHEKKRLLMMERYEELQGLQEIFKIVSNHYKNMLPPAE